MSERERSLALRTFVVIDRTRWWDSTADLKLELIAYRLLALLAALRVPLVASSERSSLTETP